MAKSGVDKVVRHIFRVSAEEHWRSQTDGELLRAFVRCGDQDAFAVLVKRYGPLVLATCRRVLRQLEDAEDVLQATFIVLARQAPFLAKKECVGGWLHHVSYRLALNARRALARRRRHERQSTAMKPTNPGWEIAWREVQILLDDEVQRLPEKYREPFILCALGGQNCAAAARQLGLKEGTVWSRLAEARKRLQKRLSSRGVELTAVLGAGALASNSAMATVPAALVAKTVEAGVAAAAATTLPAGMISNQVAFLVRGMTRALFLKKATLGAALFLLFSGLLGVAGIGAYHLDPRRQTAKQDHQPQLQRLALDEELLAPEENRPLNKDQFGDALPPGAVTRLGTTRFRHGRYVESVAFSPDGSELASSSDDGTIRFWDAKSGKELRRLPKRFQSAGHVAYIAGGKELLVGGGTGFDADGNIEFQGITVWDVNKGKLLRTLSDKTEDFAIPRVGISPRRDRVAFVRGGSVMVLDPTQPDRPTLPNGAFTIELGGVGIAHLAFSPDSRRLCVGAMLKIDGQGDRENQPSCIRIYDLETGKQIWEHKGLTASAAHIFPAAEFSPDGRSVTVSFSYKEQMFLLDAATGDVLRRFSGKTVGIWPFRFTADGTKLYTGGWRGPNQIFDVASGMPIGSWARGGEFFDVALSPDGKTIASAENRKIRLTRADNGESLPDYGAAGEIDHIELHSDGRRLLAGGYWDSESGFTIWDRTTSRRLYDHPKTAWAFCLAPNGETVAVGSDKEIVLLNLRENKVIKQEPNKDKRGVWRMAYSPDGSRIIHTGYFENKIREFDPSTMTSRQLIDLPLGFAAAAFAVFPTGDRIAVAVSNQSGNSERHPSVDIWKSDGKRKIHSLTGFTGGFPLVLAVSQNGRRVAAGSANQRHIAGGKYYDKRVLVWDADTGQQVASLPGGVNGHRCLAFSPDGRTVAAGSEDRATYLWELATGTLRAKYVGHEGPVAAVAFAPDSKTLYTGSSDTTVLAWDLVAPPNEAVNVDSAWADLGSNDGMKAHRAMRTLMSISPDVIAKLSRTLKRTPPVDEAVLKKLINDLGSPVFSTRENASKELTRQGRVCLPALRDAARSPSLEASVRAKKLIQILDPNQLSDAEIYQLRAVELLERIATVDARRLLNDLASGARGPVITEEAKAALGRMLEK